MPPRLALVAAVTVIICLGLSLAAGWSIGSRAGPDPVYSIAQVNRRLADNPRAWRGKVVRVRAIGGGCIPWAAPKDSPCIDETPELVDTSPAGAGGVPAMLQLLCGARPPHVGFVRHLPWLAHWLPGPQVLQPGTIGTYRIQLPTEFADETQLLDSLPNCGPS